MSHNSIPVSHPPANLRPMRIVCPKCMKQAPSHLMKGCTYTWCKRCHEWFKTVNEKISQGELDYLLGLEAA
jgi:hypothetical protein